MDEMAVSTGKFELTDVVTATAIGPVQADWPDKLRSSQGALTEGRGRKPGLNQTMIGLAKQAAGYPADAPVGRDVPRIR